MTTLQVTTVAAGKQIGLGTAVGFSAMFVVVAWLQAHGMLPENTQSPEATFWTSTIGMLTVVWAMMFCAWCSETEWEHQCCRLRTTAQEAVMASRAKSAFVAVMR